MDSASLEELKSAVEAVERIEALPSGDVRADPRIARLWDLIKHQIECGEYRWKPQRSPDYDLICEASDTASGPGKTVLDMMYFCNHDHGILSSPIDGLAIDRIIWSGNSADYPDLGVQLQIIGSTYTPIPTRPDEEWILGLDCELELLVKAVPEQQATQEAAERPLSVWELFGQMLTDYELRKFRRVTIGSGSCVITDQRVIGMVQKEDPPLPKGAEKMAMPHAIIDPSINIGSSVLFSVDRDQFTHQEDLQGQGGLTARWLQSRAPTIALLGEHVHLKVQPFRVIESNRRRKPNKDEILRTIRSFMQQW